MQQLEWDRALVVSFLSLLTAHLSPVFAAEGRLPSIFRGVVVADGPFGVRVVSVDESSQASLTDLRAEDVILEINQLPVRTIDEFAVVSRSLKGKASQAQVVVLRNGQPRELTLHLYSMPILQRWGLFFVHEHDIRFGQGETGLAHWSRLGRGFELAGNDEQALNAYLNALHNVPAEWRMAMKIDSLLWKIARVRLKADRLSEAIGTIQQANALLERLFEQPLEEADLKAVKQELTLTVAALRDRR
jgi:hypothetical protein